MFRSLSAPIKQIAKNAGLEGNTLLLILSWLSLLLKHFDLTLFDLADLTLNIFVLLIVLSPQVKWLRTNAVTNLGALDTTPPLIPTKICWLLASWIQPRWPPFSLPHNIIYPLIIYIYSQRRSVDYCYLGSSQDENNPPSQSNLSTILLIAIFLNNVTHTQL